MKSNPLDIAANRRSCKWSRRELLGRLLWTVVQPFFAISPRPLWGWRRWLLRAFGAKIGQEVHIYSTVRIIIPWHIEIGDQSAVGDRVILYALGNITIGQRVTISQGTHLCAGTHDYRRADRQLLKLPITVEDDSWIAADAFIGPNVTIGKGSIVGARSVVFKNVESGWLVIGNPAQPIKKI